MANCSSGLFASRPSLSIESAISHPDTALESLPSPVNLRDLYLSERKAKLTLSLLSYKLLASGVRELALSHQ